MDYKNKYLKYKKKYLLLKYKQQEGGMDMINFFKSTFLYKPEPRLTEPDLTDADIIKLDQFYRDFNLDPIESENIIINIIKEPDGTDNYNNILALTGHITQSYHKAFYINFYFDVKIVKSKYDNNTLDKWIISDNEHDADRRGRDRFIYWEFFNKNITYKIKLLNKYTDLFKKIYKYIKYKQNMK